MEYRNKQMNFRVTESEYEVIQKRMELTGIKKPSAYLRKMAMDGYSKRFFEEHREEITLHKAAKEAFSKMEKPIPKIKDLNEEYGKLLQEKKQNYAEYRKARKEMRDFQTAKYNVERFYQTIGDKEKEISRKRSSTVL